VTRVEDTYSRLSMSVLFCGHKHLIFLERQVYSMLIECFPPLLLDTTQDQREHVNLEQLDMGHHNEDKGSCQSCTTATFIVDVQQ
jgi:hypothetical protein